jgi:hypothetical protein
MRTRHVKARPTTKNGFNEELNDPVSDIIVDSLWAFLAALLALVVLKDEPSERADSMTGPVAYARGVAGAVDGG